MSEGVGLDSTKIQSPERKQSSFLLLDNEAGTFGVLKDYPNAEQVLAQIASNPSLFLEEDGLIEGHRKKSYLKIGLSDGTAIECIVKGKLGNQFSNMRYPHIPSSYANMKESEDRLQHSVLNEIMASHEAARRYRAKYGEELSIEKPVGFFISREEGHKGKRWVIFERLNNIIHSHDRMMTLRERRLKFAKQMAERLASIGIHTGGQYALDSDIIMAGDATNIDNIRYVLADTEEWGVKPEKKK